MKRTRKLSLTGLMAVGGVSLTACGDNAAEQAKIEGPPVDAYTYASLQECKDKNEIPDAACETAEASARTDADKSATYKEQASCEDIYGQGQCVPRGYNSSGGSFWGPLITGFVVGRLLDGGGGWYGRGYYRDWRDGGYYTSSGGRIYTDYRTGRTQLGRRGFDAPDAATAPIKQMSRTGAISRGGFGGRQSAKSFSSRGFGG